MKSKELTSALKQIEKSKNIIAKERDKLREIYLEIKESKENCDDAIDYLERAIDEISQTM